MPYKGLMQLILPALIFPPYNTGRLGQMKQSQDAVNPHTLGAGLEYIHTHNVQGDSRSPEQ